VRFGTISRDATVFPNLTEVVRRLGCHTRDAFLANLGRRLLQLRIAGMVAEINLARTPDGIASAPIVADESVAHHRELLQAAREAGGMALHNSVLQASLLATIEREQSSRELSETLSRLLPTGLAEGLPS
jgi:hypothetical protein